MTTETEMREAFEAHFSNKFPRWKKKRGCDGDYVNIKASIAFKAWQAATLATEARYAELEEAVKEFLRADNLRTLNPGEVNEANRYQHAFFALNKALAKLEKGEQA